MRPTMPITQASSGMPSFCRLTLPSVASQLVEVYAVEHYLHLPPRRNVVGYGGNHLGIGDEHEPVRSGRQHPLDGEIDKPLQPRAAHIEGPAVGIVHHLDAHADAGQASEAASKRTVAIHHVGLVIADCRPYRPHAPRHVTRPQALLHPHRDHTVNASLIVCGVIVLRAQQHLAEAMLAKSRQQHTQVAVNATCGFRHMEYSHKIVINRVFVLGLLGLIEAFLPRRLRRFS